MSWTPWTALRRSTAQRNSFFNARNILFFTSLSVILITLGIIQTLLFEAMSFFSQVADARGWFTSRWTPPGFRRWAVFPSFFSFWRLPGNTSSSSSRIDLSSEKNLMLPPKSSTPLRFCPRCLSGSYPALFC